MRPRVYIAGPMSQGDRIQNLANALAAYKELIALGYAPFCPHLTFFAAPFITATHSEWLEIDLPWVEKADYILRLQGDSIGATMECDHAKNKGVPVLHSIEELERAFFTKIKE